MSFKKPYRPCVLAVFQNEEGQVLACQRSDTRTWQFPQGGVEEGESEESALFREMEEEIGTKNFRIKRKASKLVRYEFPKDLEAPISKTFCGQEQRWFLCSFQEGSFVRQAQIQTFEFLDFKWTSVSFVLSQLVEWKRSSYEEALMSLGVDLK